MPYIPLKNQEFQKELQTIKDTINLKEFNLHISNSNFSELYNVFLNLETLKIDSLTFLNLKKEIKEFFPAELSSYLSDDSSLLILSKLERFLSAPSIKTLNELKTESKNSFKELSRPLPKSEIHTYVQKRMISSLIRHFDKKIMSSRNKDITLFLPTPPLSIASLVDNPITSEELNVLTSIISLIFFDRYHKFK